MTTWAEQDRGFETPCHIWQGNVTQGYARKRVGGKLLLAHRWRYEREVGPIRFDLHHRCGQKDCVRPDHLADLPNGDHMRIHKRFTTVTMRAMDDYKEKGVDAWFRQMHDGRVEIMCKDRRHRIRVTAPEAEAWEAVELFERWTGLAVESERRPPRKPRQIVGQLSMLELESG